MSAAPRLSVGLPVYNGENYLAESIEALLGQTYEDFELIISDNASTDSTADICRRYAKQDSRIRYIRQPRNIGLSPNHNFVLQEARGELFKWAAADDLYGRDLLSAASTRSTSTRTSCSRTPGKRPSTTRHVTQALDYPLATDSRARSASSFLFGSSGCSRATPGGGGSSG